MYYVNIYTSKTYRGEKLTKSNTVISSESSLARSRFRKFVIASAVNSREHKTSEKKVSPQMLRKKYFKDIYRPITCFSHVLMISFDH